MMRYNEADIEKNDSINSLPALSINSQKSRNVHLQIYKKLKLPVLIIPYKEKRVVDVGWPNFTIEKLWKDINKKVKEKNNFNLGLRLDNFVVIDIDKKKIAQEKLSDIT